MKKIFLLLTFSYAIMSNAQQFISTGQIEYEVRVNNHGVLGDDTWGRMFRDQVPKFSTSWYNLTFANDKALYKFSRQEDKGNRMFSMGGNETDNIWYSDYASQTFTDQKDVFGDTYILRDSLMNIKWKLVPTETREIAGFNCRKAQAIIFDSVYVFAFYTDEITVPGGPMGLHGLPGMILGITIPRMYTSWIASKVQVLGVNTSIVVAPEKGKKQKATELLDKIKKSTSDWGSYAQQMIWKLFL
ncbi:MAG: GLPGLI family protein [Chitinophagaceae bacterium]|jgi:GLPGLI family protein|nr:GLPGLI family protein [Chitinophagaceae bacterium]OQY96762.1 MAG: hypothetical protein B6D37_01095 [Sphingobacteriales bacterium UTBCD1]